MAWGNASKTARSKNSAMAGKKDLRPQTPAAERSAPMPKQDQDKEIQAGGAPL